MRIRHLAALTAILAFAVPALSAPARPVLTFRSDPWCPYNCDPASDHPGYAVEMVRAIFNEAGFDVDYQLLNWARSLEDARQGRADAVIGAYATDVPGFTVPREPIGISRNGFAVRRGTVFHYTDPGSLEGKVLGAVANYDFAGALGDYIRINRNDYARVQLVAGDDALDRNFAKLLAGHVDVVTDDANVLARKIIDLKLGAQVAFTIGGPADKVYIAFSPANPASPRLAALLDEGIARLRASGRLAVILARYSVKDWAGSPQAQAGLR